MKKIKKGDTVKVISWKHKGTVALIEKVLDETVVVAWVNVVKRAVKGKWYVEKTKPIHQSNVMYYDTETQQASKVSITMTADGKRKRMIVKTKRVLDK